MLYVRDWARVWCLFGPAILLLVCIKRLCSSIRSLVSHIIVYPGYPNIGRHVSYLSNRVALGRNESGGRGRVGGRRILGIACSLQENSK